MSGFDSAAPLSIRWVEADVRPFLDDLAMDATKCDIDRTNSPFFKKAQEIGHDVVPYLLQIQNEALGQETHSFPAIAVICMFGWTYLASRNRSVEVKCKQCLVTTIIEADSNLYLTEVSFVNT